MKHRIQNSRVSTETDAVPFLLDPQRLGEHVFDTIATVRSKKKRRRLMREAAAGKTVLYGPKDGGFYDVIVGGTWVLHVHWTQLVTAQTSGAN